MRAWGREKSKDNAEGGPKDEGPEKTEARGQKGKEGKHERDGHKERKRTQGQKVTTLAVRIGGQEEGKETKT